LVTITWVGAGVLPAKAVEASRLSVRGMSKKEGPTPDIENRVGVQQLLSFLFRLDWQPMLANTDPLQKPERVM
jgi:hypothetical protein